MSDLESAIVLLGKDFLSSSQPTVQALSDKIAIGISPGYTDHNEDAVGAVALEDRTILAIADGHWGDGASILAVTKTTLLLSKTSRPHGNEPNGWLYALFERINQTLLLQALQGEILSTPESSLIIAHIAHRQNGTSLVHWASFGDSFLYRCSADGKAEQLNTLRPMWLGALSALAGKSNNGRISIPYPSQASKDEYRGVVDGLEANQVILQAGDILILATDGLPQCKQYNVTSLVPSDIAGIVTGLDSAEAQCSALISTALEQGGVDNIACAIYSQISSKEIKDG